MQTPPRWKQIVAGLAVGMRRKELADELGVSTANLAASVADIQSSARAYDSVGDFLEDLFGAEDVPADFPVPDDSDD